MKPQSVRINFNSMAWKRLSKDGRRGRLKLWRSRGTRIRIIEMSPQWREDDWCSLGHNGYVLKGALILNFRTGYKKRVQILEGEGFSIPEGIPHKATCKTITDAFIVDNP